MARPALPYTARLSRVAAIAAMMAAGNSSTGTSQQPFPPPPYPFPPLPAPGPPSGQVPPSGAYRTPSLALVQPASGGTVPQDKPVVVFRLMQGDASDPIDARSFVVTVDGQDR